MKGVADELTGVDLERGLEIFDRVSQEEIGNSWVTRRCAGIGALPALRGIDLGALGAYPRR